MNFDASGFHDLLIKEFFIKMRKSPVSIFILLFCLVFSLHAQTAVPSQPNQSAPINLSQPIPYDPDVRIGKLPNGLTYYIRRNAKPEKKVELRLAVKAGSILEREDQRGLAHFVEHMAFNGTTNFAKNELVSYLQSIGVRFGGDLNAYTSFDETVYILPIPTEKKELVDKGLLVLSDWASGITFDQAEIDKERGIVLEERRMGRGANQRMQDKFFPKLLEGSQYAVRMPIGTEDVLKNFNRQTILDFYETWYRPDLMAIVAVGDLNPDEMEAKIKAQFSGIKDKRKNVERTEFPVADTKGTLVAVETDPETPSTSVQLIYKKPEAKIRTGADLRAQLIRRFYVSLLSQRINEIGQSPNSPFISAGANFSKLLGDKDAFVMAGSTSPQNVKATIQTLLDENRRVQQFGFTKGELDRLKEGYLSSLENSYNERNKTYSGSFAQSYIDAFLTGEPAWSSEFDYQFGKQVAPTITLEEINRFAKNTTSGDNRAVIITGPTRDDAKYPARDEVLALLKTSETTKLTAYTETVGSEPLVKDLPAAAKVTAERTDNKFGITYWTLSNGVKVVLKPTDFQADAISLQGFSPGGMSLVDTEKARSGMYFDSVVGESGVGGYSSIQLNKMLAGKTASASIGVGELFESVGGYSNTKDFETMLQLVYAKFTNTRLDKSVFDSVIGKQKTSVAALQASPQAYFGEQVFKILAQNQPRAFNPYDLTNYDKAKFEDIQQIYKNRFADASGFTFVFVGNFEPEKIKPLVAKYLGNLPSSNRGETWKDWSFGTPKGPLDKTFKKGVDDKAVVQIIYTGDAVYDKDENRNLALLGELLTIKLLEVLREEKSGVYGVGASGSLTKIPSGKFGFSVQFGSAPQNVESLVQATNAEIVKIQNGQIEENELNKVKQSRLVRIDEQVKTNGYWMSVISTNLQQGNDILTLEEARARISRVTKEDLQRAAQKYLKPENRLQFVLVPETAAKPIGQTPKQ